MTEKSVHYKISFLALLDLASTNCKMSDLMDTLTDPNIMVRYGFEEISELGMIRDWIVTDHIHFGLMMLMNIVYQQPYMHGGEVILLNT